MLPSQERETIIKKALHYFNNEGWNCAESVFLAISRHYYEKKDVTPESVTAYGGGIVRTGNICGAINVGIMEISQKYGRKQPDQHFAHTQRPVLKFLDVIREKLGSIYCLELSNCKLSEIEGIRKFREENVKERKCTPIVREVMAQFFYIVEDWKPP